jgi:4-hydroxy-tetrahydrodipicolinate reductase
MQQGKKIKVIQLGCGAMGQEIIRQVLSKQTLQLVGAIARKTNVGQDVGKVMGIGELGVTISSDMDSVFANTKADVLVDATASRTRLVFPYLMKALEAGLNVVTICEEMTNPWLKEPELAKKLDETAKKHGVTVVETGMNPGFYLDVLPFVVTSVCSEVRRITGERVVDSSGMPHSRATNEAFGIGLNAKEFQRKRADGSIPGHVGISETMHVFADALGWELTEVHEELEPLFSKVVKDFSPYCVIQPGQVYGLSYRGYGLRGKEVVFDFKGALCVKPNMETDRIEPCFQLSIEGNPSFKVNLEGLTTGDNMRVATAARAVNWIPYVVEAKPGLLTNLREFPLVGYSR